MLRASVIVIAGCMLVECGAASDLGAPQWESDSGTESGFPPHPTCASASGVRLCGGPCSALPAPECKGFGCTDPLDSPGGAAPVGVCWADTGEADFLCDGCAPGDACLERAPGDWVCVPADTCAALWDLGVRDVCRYADKRTYDHRLIPSATGCPAPETAKHLYYACGGDCPPCPTGARCNGVSPDHPFGLCNDGDQPYDPSFSCGGASFCAGVPGYVCAVPDVPANDLDVARQYGTCMDQPGCFDLAGRFPGGLGCYDASGHRLN